MADIDSILAGIGGNTRADFSGIADISKAYSEGRDQKAKNDLRDAFKGGVPLTADGQPDFSAMAKTLFQKGGLSEGTAAANLGLAQQNQQFGQGQSRNIQSFEGGQPSQPIVGPSTSRNTVTIDPSKRADISPPQPRGGDQPGSIVGLVSAAGVPDELAGPIIQQVSAATRMDPNAAVHPQMAPRVQQIVAEAVRRTQQAGQPQQPQMQPQQAPQPVPQAPPQAGPQAQPAPVTNAVTTTQAPATPSRIDQGIAFYAGIMSDPRSPKQNVELAKDRLKALQDNSALTSEQKNYAQAVLEGFKGTMQDYSADQESGKAAATERAKADVKEQQEYIDGGKQASNRLTTLNTLSNIISSDPNINLGFGGPTALKIKMALESAGIPVPDLSGAQAIQKLNASLASEMAKSLTSRTTQFEFKTFLGNNPGLELDKSGNERLIGIFSQLAKREVDLGRLARKNQDNWKGWDQVVENYDKQNPMRDPVTKKVLSTDTVIAPAPSKARSQVGTAQAAPAAFPNAKKAPDGNWYVPDPSRPGKYSRVVQ